MEVWAMTHRHLLNGSSVYLGSERLWRGYCLPAQKRWASKEAARLQQAREKKEREENDDEIEQDQMTYDTEEDQDK